MSALDALFRQLAGDAPARSRIHPLACIDDSVQLPENLIVQAGAYVPAGVVLAAGCRIGANVAFEDGPGTVVGRGVHIGANATLHAGLTIGAGAVVRPGAVVSQSVPPRAIVEGHPAVVVGRVDAAAGPMPDACGDGVESLPVRGVTLHEFPVSAAGGSQGIVAEFRRQIPFEPLRCAVVTDVPGSEPRGHAQRSSHQFLLCLRGTCVVVVDDGHRRAEVVLTAPQRGLHLPPMTWSQRTVLGAEALLMVFESQPDDEADEIRDHGEFLAAVAERRTHLPGILPSTPLT